MYPIRSLTDADLVTFVPGIAYLRGTQALDNLTPAFTFTCPEMLAPGYPLPLLRVQGASGASQEILVHSGNTQFVADPNLYYGRAVLTQEPILIAPGPDNAVSIMRGNGNNFNVEYAWVRLITPLVFAHTSSWF